MSSTIQKPTKDNKARSINNSLAQIQKYVNRLNKDHRVGCAFMWLPPKKTSISWHGDKDMCATLKDAAMKGYFAGTGKVIETEYLHALPAPDKVRTLSFDRVRKLVGRLVAWSQQRSE